MEYLTDLRSWIEELERLLFEQDINRENKKVLPVLQHIKVAKEVAEHSDNPRSWASWLIIIKKDYDKMCNIVFENLKKKERRAKAGVSGLAVGTSSSDLATV